MTCRLDQPLILYSGKFSRGNIFVIFNLFVEKNSLVYSSVLSQLNHKIKSLWVKHLWFYSNHENHEDISPQKFSTIIANIIG